MALDQKIWFADIIGAVVLVLFLSCASPLQASQSDYDIIIKGGTIYDGSLNEPYMADIGIKGDKISAVGNFAGKTGAKVIDANSLIVTPGFTDVHTHSDLSFMPQPGQHASPIRPSTVRPSAQVSRIKPTLDREGRAYLF